MTKATKDEFLDKLFKVIKKLAGIAKTQGFRFQDKWKEYLSDVNTKPHLIRPISLDEEKFFNDIEYRIETLKTVSNAIVDGYYSIKTLLQALYDDYFKSESFKIKYPHEDQIKIQYIVAKEILGNLIQYNKIDHKTVPLKYNIIARNYTLIKLKGQNDKSILSNMNKIFNDELDIQRIQSTMKAIEQDGIISIQKKNGKNLYVLEKELELSDDAKKKYNEGLHLLVNWPTNFWRSFYNIRELNITPAPSIKHHDFLSKVLSRSATQGFGPADYVMKHLVKYFEKLRDEKV